MILISHLDHFVLTVRDLGVTCDFYKRVLGMRVERFEGGRLALRYGDQKINLHEAGREYEPHAKDPVPGSADLCFIVHTPIESVLTLLEANNINIIEGIVPRTGAQGPMRSIYFRDPDGNLIELSSYEEE
jgi:catechol 2,3-dioxygenase-like lactoylglutathione lyase family enzyme